MEKVKLPDLRASFNQTNVELKSAVAIDRFASGEFRTLWNKIFIKKFFGHKFNGDYTISYYLGKNEHFGTLSDFGEFFVYLLDLIDKDHCKKAYEHFEGKIK